MYESVTGATNEGTWRLEDAWVRLARLVKKGSIAADPTGLLELDKVLSHVTMHYPPVSSGVDWVGEGLSAAQLELSMIFENTIGLVKACYVHTAIVKSCLAILRHLAYPPATMYTSILNQEVNTLISNRKNITRLLRVIPAHVANADVVGSILLLLLRIGSSNPQALCSHELTSVLKLPDKWKGPGNESSPASGHSATANDRASVSSASEPSGEPPACKRRHSSEGAQGEIYSLSYQCLSILNCLENAAPIVVLVCQLVQTMCTQSQNLFPKIMAHQLDIGIMDRLLAVFEDKVEQYRQDPAESLSKTLDALLVVFVKVFMFCKLHHVDCKAIQKTASVLVIKAIRPCLEYRRSHPGTLDPKDLSLLSNVFRFCLHIPVHVSVDNYDIVLFSVELLAECRGVFKPYLPHALRFAYGVGSALPQADWINSFRTKKKHGLHRTVLKCLESGHVQDDSVLKESLRILRSLVSDALWNADLFADGILETLSNLSFRLSSSDDYAAFMLDVVRIGFQLTCCSLQLRREFIDRKYVAALHLALMNYMQNWSIVRCVLGSLSMLFRVEQVVRTAFKLNFVPLLLEMIEVHGPTESKQRYIHNVITHMMCLGVPTPQLLSPTSDSLYLPKASMADGKASQLPNGQALPALNGMPEVPLCSKSLVRCANQPKIVHKAILSANSMDIDFPSPVTQTQGSGTTACLTANEDSRLDHPCCPAPDGQLPPTLAVSRLHGMASHGCSTCSGPSANSLELILTAKNLSVDTYEDLSLRGWFRRGSVPLSHYRYIHHPDCGDYETRTNVRLFDPLKSSTYKRVLKRAKKAGVTVETVRPQMDNESYELYNRYQQSKHGKPLKAADGYCNHIVDTPLVARTLHGIPYGTVHQLYRMDGCLIGVGVLDVLPHCLISVYMFYDVDRRDVAKLSLGVYAVLQEIEYANELNRQGADIGYYMLGGFCPLNRKVSYKANYHPVQFCVPWASSYWFDDLRAARLLAGLSALRQSVRSHRLSAIRSFLVCYGLPASSFLIMKLLRESELSMFDLVSLIRASETGKSSCVDAEMDIGISPATSSEAASLPADSTTPSAIAELVYAEECSSFPAALRDFCDRLVAVTDSYPCTAFSALSEKVVGFIVDDRLFRYSDTGSRVTPALGHLLEAVFERSLADCLSSDLFARRDSVTVAELLAAVQACIDNGVDTSTLGEAQSLLMGCERNVSELDPDCARPVTVEEAFHGLCQDTVIDLLGQYTALIDCQQIAGSADSVPLCVDLESGEQHKTTFSELYSNRPPGQWWPLSQELLHHNLLSLSGALGPKLLQHTVVRVTAVEE